MTARKTGGHPTVLIFLGDLVAVATSYYVTFLIRFHSVWGERFFGWFNALIEAPNNVGPVDYLDFYASSGPRIILFIWGTLLILYGLADLYAGPRFLRRRGQALDVLKANAVALALFYGYFYLSRNQFHPRSMFVTVLFCNTLLTLLLRSWARRRASRLAEFACPTLVAGSAGEASQLAQWLNSAHPWGIRVVRRVPWDPDQPPERFLAELEGTIRETGASLLVCADRRLPLSLAMQVVEKADAWGVAVKILSDEMNVLPHKARVAVDEAFDSALVHFAGESHRRWPLAVRRVLSVAIALLLLILFLPLLLLMAVLIKLTSPGPIFFVQERIGVNRKPFLMYKFRTMHTRAEEVQAELEELNESGEALFKIRADPRVTPVGRALRRFSLDEFPQLWNVLRGEMLIVGPRPLPKRDFANYYEEWHYQRHSGLPGLTCLWQVSGRSDIGFRNMCILDIYYLQNASFWLDLRIMLKTVTVVLFARGAY